MAIIEVNHLSYAYPTHLPGTPAIKVLDDVSLRVEKGEAFALMGPSGAGKSTLCLALNGVIPHLVGGELQGQVVVDRHDTRLTPPTVLASTIGIVYQDPESQLFCTTVEEEVAFGLENLGIAPAEIEERIRWVLQVVKMDSYRTWSPARLSGGQKQRVAIACSLALLPEILILDEPTSSLDPAGQAEVFEAVDRLRHERLMTLILVSTDAERIARYATRMAYLVAGAIIAQGEPASLLADRALTTQAAIYPPQVMELAWEMNALYHEDYHWLQLEQAESDLRVQLRNNDSDD